MPTLSSIEVLLGRLEKKWFAEKPPFNEGAIEAALLLELFRSPLGLGFNDKSAKHQQAVPNGNGIVDILLKLNRKTRVVVEVKQPGTLGAKRSKWKGTVGQAGRYVRHLGQEYGIATDGLIWFYFKVKRYRNYYLIHPLIRFHIKENRPLALRILERSKRTTLKDFLDVLAAIHGHMKPKEFDKLMNLGLRHRVHNLVEMAKNHKVKVAAADKAVIRALYSETQATRLIQPLLKPLKLTKK